MSTAIQRQFRKGTVAQVSGGSFVPAIGEPIFATDTKNLYVGDGSTVGGIMVPALGQPNSVSINGNNFLTLTNPNTGTSSDVGLQLWNSAGGVSGVAAYCILNGSGATGTGFGANSQLDIRSDNGYVAIGTNSGGGALRFLIANVEQGRFEGSAGNFLLGVATNIFTGRRLQVNGGSGSAAVFKNTANANETIDIWNADTTGNNLFVTFNTEGSFAQRGSISYNRGSAVVAYNTTSDRRAKTIADGATDLNAIMAGLRTIPVHMGIMTAASDKTPRPILIADEVQLVAPEAVTGDFNAVDDKNNPVYQQMDATQLVARLLAGLQAVDARVTILESH